MKTRSHENTSRLTARERAKECVRKLQAIWYAGDAQSHIAVIQRAIAAAVREALARNDRRARKGR